MVCRQVGGTASAKLKRGAVPDATAALHAAATAGILPPSVWVDRGGEKVKDCSAGGDRELVRISGVPVAHISFALSPAALPTDVGDTCIAPAPFAVFQLACCAAVALVR